MTKRSHTFNQRTIYQLHILGITTICQWCKLYCIGAPSGGPKTTPNYDAPLFSIFLNHISCVVIGLSALCFLSRNGRPIIWSMAWRR